MGLHRLTLVGSVGLGAIALLGLAADTVPDEVAVRMGVTKEGAEALEVIWRARAVGHLGEGEAPTAHRLEGREGALEAPGDIAISLPRGVVWQIELEAPGYWHEPGTVVVPHAGDPPVYKTELRKLATVTGSIVGRFDGPLDGLRCSFLRSAGDDESSRALELDGWRVAQTAVDVRRFRCQVPSGENHLKVQLPGHVPKYFWNLEMHSERPSEIGDLVIQRGASVIGQVLVEGPLHEAPIEVALVPATIGTGPLSVERQLGAMRASQRVDVRGFFQLSGISYGTWALVATADGMAPARRDGLEIQSDGEHVLAEPILLMPPSTLEIQIDPPVHPYGTSWSIELVAIEAAGTLRLVDRKEVDLDGTANLDELTRGSYELFVLGPSDSRFGVYPLHLGDSRELKRIDLTSLVEIVGELRLGDEPIAGTVYFGGRDSKESIAVEADEGGEFVTHLPHAGRWEVDVRHLDGSLQAARPIEVPGDRHEVEVVVRLADGEIRGMVVDDEDRPVAGALIILVDTATRRPAVRSRSDETGRFRLPGIAAGDYFAYAEHGTAASLWSSIALDEGERRTGEKLVLHGQRVVRGKVVDPYGPVPGASVALLPDAPAGAPTWVVRGMSGADGSFSVKVPQSARSARIIVQPPGRAWTVRREGLTADGQLEIPVEVEGGLLIIEVAEDSKGGLLFRSGVEIELDHLRAWATRFGTGEKLTISAPNVEPGHYMFCPVEMLIESSSAGTGAGCPSGHLTAGGLLALRVPSDTIEEKP